MNKLIHKLEKITEIASVSGNEGGISLWLKKELKSFADKIVIDKTGNLIATKGKPKIAIFSHMDRIGFMVSKIENSLIKAVPIKRKVAFSSFGKGSLFPVLVGKKEIKGMLVGSELGIKGLQVVADEKKFHTIEIGDFISLAPNFTSLGKSFVTSQGLDNSLGLLAGMEVFKKVDNIVFVGTVQEEFTHMGAKVATWALKPEKIIVLDATYDEGSEADCAIECGKGPSICIKDSVFSDKKMVDKLIQIAKKDNIPYQLEVLEKGGSDALGFYDLFGAIPFVFVGIPVEFMHTAWEFASMKDVKNGIELVSNFIEEL